MNKVRWVLGLLLVATLARADLPSRSDHKTMSIVPAIGPVTIDGSLKDGEWDRSGRIHVYGSRNARDRYSCDFNTMWDKDYLYIGLEWRDTTPMVNNVDARGAPYDGWHADAVQMRFVTGGGEGIFPKGGDGYKRIHCDFFYSSKSDMVSAALSYAHSMALSGNMAVMQGEGKKLEDKSGFQMAFKKNDDNKGYVQEMRIPWSLLYTRVPPIQAGLKMRMTGEFYWGSPQAIKWPQFFHQDPMAAPDRTNVYKSPQNWGRVELVAENNLPTEEPSVRDFEGGKEVIVSNPRIQGVLPIRFEVPYKSARKFTVAIEKDGKRYRNLVANVDIDNYTVEKKGDVRVVEVLWDGRQESTFNYGWDEFVGYAKGTVPNNIGSGKDFLNYENMVIAVPGEYEARIIVHDGLKAIYEGDFYNPGNPPWPSADGSGGWLGDHHAPSFVSTMPPGAKSKDGVVFMSSPGGECGVPFIGIGRDGEKIWSWVRQTSKVMAHGASDTELFFGFTYAGRLHWGKVNPDTGVQKTFSNGMQDLKLPDTGGGARFFGFAVNGDTVAISLGYGGMIFCNTESGEQLKFFPECKFVCNIQYLPGGKQLIGMIYGEGKLVTVDVETGKITPLEIADIGKVSAFAMDSKGRLYVSRLETETIPADRKARRRASVKNIGAQTIQVYDGIKKDAELIAVIGEPGGRNYGPYNKMRINQPVSMAVEERPDGQFLLWVIEAQLGGRGNYMFRRQSVWDVTKPAKWALHREYVGNTGYQGSGGSLSDDDPTLGLYNGTMFRLNYEKYTYDPIYIMEGGAGGTGERTFGNGYHFFSDVSGKKREYYVAANTLYINTTNGWRRVWDTPSIKNGYQWGYRCYRDLVWYSAGNAYRPKGFDADGAPIYGDAEKLPGELGSHTPSPRNDTYKTQYGWYSMDTRYGPNPERVTWNCPEIVGFDKDGTRRWAYPSFWWSTHGASTAPMSKPGRIIGQLKWLGVINMDDGHSYMACRGYKGQDFYLRDDGMYVGELFQDFRGCDKIMPDDKHVRGLDISDISLTEEIFCGYMGRQTDGVVRTTFGHTDVRIAQVHGLETVKDLPSVKVKVTAEDVVKMQDFVPTMGKKVTEYTIARGGAFDVNSVDFGKALKIAEVGGGQFPPLAVMRYDDNNLYIAYKVSGDATPWFHAPDQGYATLFKSGDMVGFMHNLENSEGTRIVMAAPGGKSLATIHRPDGPGNASYTYTSPVRSVTFKHVAQEPAITFTTKVDKDSYVVAAVLPWKVLGATPKSGLKFRGDLEVAFGSEQSSHVQKLLRWVDPIDSIHDLPTEAELQPAKFGTFVLE